MLRRNSYFDRFIHASFTQRRTTNRFLSLISHDAILCLQRHYFMVSSMRSLSVTIQGCLQISWPDLLFLRSLPGGRGGHNACCWCFGTKGRICRGIDEIESGELSAIPSPTVSDRHRRHVNLSSNPLLLVRFLESGHFYLRAGKRQSREKRE